MDLFIDAHPKKESVRDAVVAALSSEPRTLPPRLFYDERGSQLFERITRLPEYYLTRAEVSILRAHARDMAGSMHAPVTVIEYGSGSSEKTDILLRVVPPDATYIPVDISREHLLHAAMRVAGTFPSLTVLPVCADYDAPLPALASFVRGRDSTVFFPGSTIGNFEPEHAREFLVNIATLVGPGGGLLIGIDLRKDAALLEAAYNDSQGVTAEFNLNMLRHVNRRIGHTFDVSRFRHRAFWNADEGRIEMHLVALYTQKIRIDGRQYTIPSGEPLVTEYSYKYSREEANGLLETGGFRTERTWTDPDGFFSVCFARAR